MKYFICYKEDTNSSQRFPTPAIFDLVEGTRQYFDDLKRKDKVVDWGFFGADHALYAVLNVRSAAELYEIVELAPVRPICHVESSAILESGEFSDAFARVRREGTAAWERLSRHQSDRSKLS